IERARRVESCFRRDADRAALLYSPRSESQFKTRCLDESFEEFIFACKSRARYSPMGCGLRMCIGHAGWDSDHFKRAVAFAEEDSDSRGPRAQRAHRRIAGQPSDRD